jgi:hypothetical protein
VIDTVHSSKKSKHFRVEFNFIASLHVVNGIDINPKYGPRSGFTQITIMGSNFDHIEKTLLCLIDNDWVYASLIT